MNKTLLFQWLVRVIVMVTALPVHECAHAVAAGRLGDDTAAKKGRLTLNPFAHLDLLGSLLLVFSGFGWAKPVPVDPLKLRNPRRDMALCALAGPVSNLLLAALLMCGLKLLTYMADLPALRYSNTADMFITLLFYMVIINLNLAAFNLIPMPPLDGSKILGALLPEHIYFLVLKYERYLILLVFALIWAEVLSGPLSTIVEALFGFLDFITRPIDLIFL